MTTGAGDVPDALSSALAGRYLIEGRIGTGGMATVWLARDLRHDRSVALKLMRPDLAETLGPERFLREIQIAAGLTHPHILPLHDSGSAAGFLYYVMPFVGGESLRTRLAREKALPVEEAMEITRILGGALGYAHAHGVVHRDIKPGNILFEAGHPILMDFGIARAVSAAGMEPLTVSGLALGTPAYMSPEQAGGQEQLDGRSDIYSLACVLYEMLIGTPPFPGTSVQAVLARHLNETVPALRTTRPDIPVHVEAAILRALAKSPAARFSTPAEFLDALSRPAPRTLWRSRRLLLGAMALVLIGGAALLARTGWRPWTRPDTRIAVLPYEIRGLPGDSTFADGLAEALTSSLAGIRGITVIGRQSMLRYKNSVKSAAEIGKELRVAYLLSGTLTWTRDNPPPGSIRITSSLQSTTDGGVVWTRTDDRPAAELFSVQAGITENVAARLKISLGREEQRALRTPLTANTAAYREYLLGRGQLLQRTQARLEAAIDHFQRAIALDSTFVEAYVGLANSWIGYPSFWNRVDSTRNLVPSAAEAYGRADLALRRALSLDSTLIEARSQLAILNFHRSLDADRAGSELAAVIAREPNSQSAHQGLRSALVAQGRVAEALVQSRKAVELDPLSPLANTYLGVDLAATGHTPEAMQALRTAIEVGPSFSAAFMTLGTLQLQSGHPEAGADTLRRFLELRGYPPGDDSVVAAALAGRGSVPLALAVLDRFAQNGWEPELRIAGLYAVLGSRQRALDILEEAKRRAMWELTIQRYQPFFAILQNEPRFKALWASESR